MAADTPKRIHNGVRWNEFPASGLNPNPVSFATETIKTLVIAVSRDTAAAATNSTVNGSRFTGQYKT